jgi:hypothetical protein
MSYAKVDAPVVVLKFQVPEVPDVEYSTRYPVTPVSTSVGDDQVTRIPPAIAVAETLSGAEAKPPKASAVGERGDRSVAKTAAISRPKRRRMIIIY